MKRLLIITLLITMPSVALGYGYVNIYQDRANNQYAQQQQMQNMIRLNQAQTQSMQLQRQMDLQRQQMQQQQLYQQQMLDMQRQQLELQRRQQGIYY